MFKRALAILICCVLSGSFSVDSAEAQKTSKIVKKQLKKKGWRSSLPPNTTREINTVWLIGKRQWLPICVEEPGGQAFVNPTIVPDTGIVWEDFFKRKEFSFDFLAKVDPTAFKAESAALKSNLGYTRVKSYTVDFGAIETKTMQIDPTGLELTGIRDEACSARVQAWKTVLEAGKSPLKKGKLTIIIGTAAPETMKVVFDKNPEKKKPENTKSERSSPANKKQDSGSENKANAASSSNLPEPSKTDKSKVEKIASAATSVKEVVEKKPSSDDSAPSKPRNKGNNEVTNDDKNAGNKENEKCGFYLSSEGPVFTGAGAGLTIQSCSRTHMDLGFEQPRYIGYIGMEVKDYEDYLSLFDPDGAEFSSEERTLKLRFISEEDLNSKDEWSADEIQTVLDEVEEQINEVLFE